MRCALYARVSTNKQETANQLAELRTFCAKSAWEIAVEYTDDGISGSGKKTRPAFEQMMADASKRKFEMLLFWKLDRLSREGVRATLAHLTKLECWGVAWRSYSEPYFDSCGPFKDAVISIMASLASMERAAISDRTKAGMQRVRKSGTKSGKPIGRPGAVLNFADVLRRRKAGESLRTIAAVHNVSPSLIVKRLKQTVTRPNFRG